MSKRAKVVLSLAVVLLIAGAIFFFSSQNGDDSGQLSERVVEALLRAFVPGYEGLTDAARTALIDRWQPVVRKLAHFSEYAALGLALAMHIRARSDRLRLRVVALIACAIAAAYAATDELHQTIVSDRAGMPLDVLIDSAGAAAGAAAGALFLAARRRGRRRQAT